jgi:hypothetical protein
VRQPGRIFGGGGALNGSCADRTNRRLAGSRLTNVLGVCLLFVALMLPADLHDTERLTKPDGQEETSSPAPNSPVPIEIDGTQAQPQEGANLYTVCRLTPPASGSEPVWANWITLEGARLNVLNGAMSTVPAYALKQPDGFAVLIVNHSRAKVAVRLGARLTPGVWNIERFSSNPWETETWPRLERLQSVVRDTAGSEIKPGWLSPGQAAIYRYTHRSAQVASAYRAVKSQTERMKRGHPVVYRRLKPPLEECSAHVERILNGSAAKQRYANVRSIHRALLTVAHLLTLAKNARQEDLPVHEADALLEALYRLEEMLAELSANSLDLVPGMTISAPDPKQPQERQITVSLRNAGQRSVSYVRIQVTATDNAAIHPDEPAMFQTLNPGQSVRATFQLKLSEYGRGIVARIGYYTERAPASLRLKAI